MAGNALHTIMVPVRGDGKGDNVLAHAAALAHRFGARVRVVHCHPKTDDLMPFGVVIPQVVRSQIEAAVRQNAEVHEDKLSEEFRALAAKFGLAEQDPEPGKATARFIEYRGKQTDAVQRMGRLADIICVQQPDPKLGLGKNTLKAALFSSGRPVMMCPHTDKVAPDFSTRLAIGWNGSLEASRAVALAMPLIQSAESVTILSSSESEHAASPEDLKRYLELKSVAAEIRRFEPASGLVGTQLLDETAASGAGMLIMGAYHDSYERESLFGGNSQLVVDKATFPVVFVH
jgi:nucleotide-binding universal stress UspA family protein